MATRKKAKAKPAVGRVFVLPDGTKYNIVGETGKYILCNGGIQFRKARGEILNIPVAVEAKSEEEK